MTVIVQMLRLQIVLVSQVGGGGGVVLASRAAAFPSTATYQARSELAGGRLGEGSYRTGVVLRRRGLIQRGEGPAGSGYRTKLVADWFVLMSYFVFIIVSAILF